MSPSVSAPAARDARGWFLWVLAASFGTCGLLLAVAAIAAPLAPTEWLPATPAAELAARLVGVAIGGLFVLTAVGLVRLRRWAFWLAVAWCAASLVRLLVWNLDPDRSALLVVELFSLLMAVGLPFLILRRGRFPGPSARKRTPSSADRR